MIQEQTDALLSCAASLLQDLPTSLIKRTDPDQQKLSAKDVVGTAFACMLIGAGIKPGDLKPTPDGESYLVKGFSHTSGMHVWHFNSSTRADRDGILKSLERLLS